MNTSFCILMSNMHFLRRGAGFQVFILMKDIDRLSKVNSNDIEDTNNIIHKAAVKERSPV